MISESLRAELIALLSEPGDRASVAARFPAEALGHAWGVAWSKAFAMRSNGIPADAYAGLLAALQLGSFRAALRSPSEVVERYTLVGHLAMLAEAGFAVEEGQLHPQAILQILQQIVGLGIPPQRFEHPEAGLVDSFVHDKRFHRQLGIQLSWRMDAGAVLAWALGLRSEIPKGPSSGLSDPLIGLPTSRAALGLLLVTAQLRPMSEILAARAEWEKALPGLQEGSEQWSHTIETIRTLRWLTEPWWPELALTPWKDEQEVVRDYARSDGAPAVAGACVDGRRVRRALASVVMALACLDQLDAAKAIAFAWPLALRELEPQRWARLPAFLPPPLAGAVEAMIGAFHQEQALAEACVRVHEAAMGVLQGDLQVDPAGIGATERFLQRCDPGAERLTLPRQAEPEALCALASRIGARLMLSLIELCAPIDPILEADAITMLRKLPTEFGWWAEGMPLFLAVARGRFQQAQASEEARAVLLEISTALALLNLGLQGDPPGVGWATAEAGAAWTRVISAMEKLAAGESLSFLPDPRAEEILQKDRAECWSLSHLQGSEERWEAFMAELKDWVEQWQRGTLSQPGASLKHLARWAELDGVPPELQGVPLAVGQRLLALAQAASGQTP